MFSTVYTWCKNLETIFQENGLIHCARNITTHVCSILLNENQEQTKKSCFLLFPRYTFDRRWNNESDASIDEQPVDRTAYRGYPAGGVEYGHAEWVSIFFLILRTVYFYTRRSRPIYINGLLLLTLSRSVFAICTRYTYIRIPKTL